MKLSKILNRERDPDTAIRIIESAINVVPDSEVLYRHLILFLQEQESYQDAISAYEKFCSSNGLEPDASASGEIHLLYKGLLKETDIRSA